MGEQDFKTRVEVLSFLRVQGYKISKAKFYNDIKAGRLILEADGSVLRTSADRYIAVARLSRPAEMTVTAAAKIDRKVEEEIRQLRLKNERLQYELGVMQGKYIEKPVAEAEQADLAALMDALPRHVLMLNCPRYLAAIGAEPTKARLFFDLFDRDFTQAVNQICDDGGVWLEPESGASNE